MSVKQLLIFQQDRALTVEDVDKENWNDPFQVGLYAFDIFNYYKEREVGCRDCPRSFKIVRNNTKFTKFRCGAEQFFQTTVSNSERTQRSGCLSAAIAV